MFRLSEMDTSSRVKSGGGGAYNTWTPPPGGLGVTSLWRRKKTTSSLFIFLFLLPHHHQPTGEHHFHNEIAWWAGCEMVKSLCGFLFTYNPLVTIPHTLRYMCLVRFVKIHCITLNPTVCTLPQFVVYEVATTVCVKYRIEPQRKVAV